MKVKNITTNQLKTALNMVNIKHGYKLIFNRFPEKKGNFLHFTIKSEESGISGARTSHSGRNLISASWHAHGYLFEEILAIEPTAIIKSLDKTIDINGGNWQDSNIGSQMRPMLFSDTSIL